MITAAIFVVIALLISRAWYVPRYVRALDRAVIGWFADRFTRNREWCRKNGLKTDIKYMNPFVGYSYDAYVRIARPLLEWLLNVHGAIKLVLVLFYLRAFKGKSIAEVRARLTRVRRNLDARRGRKV